MKPSVRLLPLLLHFFFLIPGVNGQSWEVYFDHDALRYHPPSVIYPGPNGTVRLGVNKLYPSSETTLLPIFFFDETGDLIIQDSIGWSSRWELIHGDKTGATYWIKNNQLRKLNANNQIVWTYPTVGDEFSINFLINGNICLPGFDGTNGFVDLINANGQFLYRFNIVPDQFFAGCDNSFIYTYDPWWVSSTRHWVKINQLGQVVWERDLEALNIPLSGSFYDGSTFILSYENKSIMKLNATGEIAWQRDLVLFSPNNNGFFHFLGALVREDGSIILTTWNYINNIQTFITQFININPANGNAIWISQVGNPTGSTLVGPMTEMTDGGILACFRASSIGLHDQNVLIVRTDAQGKTLTNLIKGKVRIDENEDCTAQTDEAIYRIRSIRFQKIRLFRRCQWKFFHHSLGW